MILAVSNSLKIPLPNLTRIHFLWFGGYNQHDAEAPILWPPDARSWFIGKDPDAGRDWGQEEKGMTEDEMAGWHHWLDAHEFGWTPEAGDGQGGLACCDSWGSKESDTSEWLNWTERKKVPTGIGHIFPGPEEDIGGRWTKYLLSSIKRIFKKAWHTFKM